VGRVALDAPTKRPKLDRSARTHYRGGHYSNAGWLSSGMRLEYRPLYGNFRSETSPAGQSEQNTAFEAMKRLRLQPPAIEETNSSFIVKIKHEPLATPEQSIMDLAIFMTVTAFEITSGRALLAIRSFRHSLPLSKTRRRPTL